MAAKKQTAESSGKAARGRPFEKGKSGNPGGRKKKTEEERRVEEMARVHTEDALTTLVTIMKNPVAKDSARVTAACAVLDRGWGKAPQVVELGNKDGQPLALTNVPPELATQIYLERVRGQIPK